jgi:hypothetical protein
MNASAKAANTSANVASKATMAVKNTADKALETLKNISKQDPTKPESPLFWGILTFLILFIFFYVIPVLIMRSRASTSNPDNIATIKSVQVAIIDSKLVSEYKDKKSLAKAIEEQQVTDKENCLINFQPLTVIQPGFLGPIKDGVYDEKQGVTAALRMGARCLVLPIDYHDKDTMAKPFPEALKPCLLFRDSADTIRSINAGDLALTAQTIADVAWSDLLSQKNDPLILVLYFVRTPEPNTKEYLNYLSQVARALAPLSPYLLGQTPMGVFNRQRKQDDLMFVNTNQLEKKLIVLCNVDTSGFRTSQKDFKRTYLPKEDLDYWVHMRIYKQNLDTIVGATSIADKKETPRAYLDRTNYYVTLPTDASTKRNAVDMTKEKFMIALSPEGKNPEVATAVLALDTYGAQAVPLLLIDYTPDTRALLSKWKYAWKAKPKEIRYVRPDPIEIQQQSPSVNANGGSITSPT